MLNNYETELLRCVAASPLDVPRYLVSPEISMAGQWFSSPFSVKVFSSIAHDALLDKSTSLVSILSQCNANKEESEFLKGIWRLKSGGLEEAKAIVVALRDKSMEREVNRIWGDYNSKLKTSPTEIRTHINDMGAELSVVSHDGVGYDSRPSAHYDDEGIEITGSWRCHAIDQLWKGVPTAGYALFIAPSGFGKSSFSRSCIAYSVIKAMTGESISTLIATNEMDAGVTSRGIRDAVRDIWQGEKSNDEIDRDIDRYVKVYEDVYSFGKFEQMIYWHRPNFAVIDSLDALGFPSGTEKLQDAEKHQARAIRLHDISKKYGCFILVPSNASGENQKELKNGNLNKVQNAQAFGSAWYQSKSIISTIMTWDCMNPQMSLFKNVKHRQMGQLAVGEVVSMAHSSSGHYYYDPTYVQLN